MNLIMALFLAATLHSAMDDWGVTFDASTIQMRMEPLNDCSLRKPEALAVIEAHHIQTTVTYTPAQDEDTIAAGSASVPAAEETHSYLYVIKINSNCRWGSNARLLNRTIVHEFGHVLLGAAYHSKDPHDVMFWIVSKDAVVTDADRALIKHTDHDELKPYERGE